MKIVYCIMGTYNSGGMERVLANKANYLSVGGYDVSIVTTDQDGRTPYFPLHASIRRKDLAINYSELEFLSLCKKVARYRCKQQLHKKRLTQFLKEEKPDIVISMFDHDSSFLHKIQDGSKKVLEIHFSRFKRLQYGRKGLWWLVDRLRSVQDARLAKRYDRFVVLTNEDRLYWGNIKNIVVIPNANSFVPKCQANVEAKRAIAVGRYDYQKGFDELIAVWNLVHTACPTWELDIFGQGPLKDDLQLQINQTGLEDVIHLREPVQDIEREYAKSGMLLATSRYEGLPMALLEAQACGLPLAAYSCKCGPKDIIKDGENGFLIEPRDRATMAERVIELIKNDKLRQQMGTKGREMSAAFSEKKIMQQWLNLFNQLIR